MELDPFLVQRFRFLVEASR